MISNFSLSNKFFISSNSFYFFLSYNSSFSNYYFKNS